MKKLVFFLMALPLVMLVSCEERESHNLHPEEFIGTWEAEKVSIKEYRYSGTSFTSSQILHEIEFEAGDAPLLILNANGTYEQKQEGEETIIGTWSVNSRGRLIAVRNGTNDKTEFFGTRVFEDVLSLSHWISEPVDGLRIAEEYVYRRIIW